MTSELKLRPPFSIPGVSTSLSQYHPSADQSGLIPFPSHRLPLIHGFKLHDNIQDFLVSEILLAGSRFPINPLLSVVKICFSPFFLDSLCIFVK